MSVGSRGGWPVRRLSGGRLDAQGSIRGNLCPEVAYDQSPPLCPGSSGMLAPFLALLLQVPAPAPQSPTTPPVVVVGDTAAKDSAATGGRRRREEKPIKRVTVTEAHLASAFRDAPARALLLLARDARLRQDSALASYDATTYQRISAGFAFTKFGRERLAFRTEDATRVRWRRGIGAYVD